MHAKSYRPIGLVCASIYDLFAKHFVTFVENTYFIHSRPRPMVCNSDDSPENVFFAFVFNKTWVAVEGI